MTSRSPWLSKLAAGASTALLLVACAGPGDGEVRDHSLDGLAITTINPGTVLPGSVLVVEGTSFVDEPWGTAQLRLRGDFAGSAVDVTVPARFVDYTHLQVDVSADLLGALSGAGELRGEAVLQIRSAVDDRLYESPPLAVRLAVASELTPHLDNVPGTGVIYVNEPMTVVGKDLLLGGDEGTSYAVVEGCFRAQGDTTCAPLSSSKIPLVPVSTYDRTRATFAFVPEIAGIRPGTFVGSVRLRNEHGAGGSIESEAADVDYELLEVRVTQVSPEAASLGQYVEVRGGGFVGGGSDQQTLLQLSGTFTRDDSGEAEAIDMILVPEFVAGPLVRYVLNEDDALGSAINLRKQTGSFSGTVTPLVSYAGQQVTGRATPTSFRIAPVKQVVYLNFLPSYRESLRKFGLRALDAQIRERVLEVARRDYATVNLEFRDTVPTDFAHYTQVDVAGPDPNGQGLLGYDNTPGKDNNNQRLFDRIGGVNATTQQDGYPGYGGVFIESMFSFSKHPNGLAKSIDGSDASFDDIFDPFRPDAGGTAVNAADFDAGIPRLTDGGSCPADDGSRADRAACAVWVLGSLIGTTLTHEIGHSLGMANPGGEGFHNFGDQPNRLMDPGGARPFTERAELFGNGPAVFCDEEYTYLRRILPSPEPESVVARPICF